MKNIQIEKDYKAYTEIKASFSEAEKAGNRESMDAARAEMNALMGSIENRGKDYSRTYRDYADAKERGNEYIDLHDAIWDQEVETLIKRFKDFGIEKFTFSSTWSSAVETAWLFTENGCRLEGLIQINGTSRDWETGKYDRIPAYVFSIE